MLYGAMPCAFLALSYTRLTHFVHLSVSVIRCNEYNLKDYLPVYISSTCVGYAHLDFVSELTLLQQGGHGRCGMDAQGSACGLGLGSHAHPSPNNTIQCDAIQARACVWRWTATWSWPQAPTPPRSARGKTWRSWCVSCQSIHACMHALED
jgi:hypothetical protein